MSLLAAALFLSIGASPATTSPKAVVLGVLEHPQCAEDPARAVRPLFAKQGNDWLALSSEAAAQPVDLGTVTWTVAFDGRRLGSIRTTDPGFRSPYSWTYPRDRRLEIAKGGPVPAISNTGGAFAGWCDVPQSRPLVLVSMPNFRDPQSWKRVTPHPTLRSDLFQSFAAVRGKAYGCPDDSGRQPEARSYSAADLIITASYRDSAGAMLVGLTLDPKIRTCDGPPEELDATHWFLVAGAVRYLGVGFSLVDAGDYDGDGRSEVLFWYSAYNKDGYTLFYDAFQKRVDFRWTYH